MTNVHHTRHEDVEQRGYLASLFQAFPLTLGTLARIHPSQRTSISGGAEARAVAITNAPF